MGVPASIDNDLGCTALAIGTDTALNTIVQACDHIDDTARAHRRAFVVEVMGRACGYLAMASAVAVGADVALFREQKRDEATLVRAVSEAVRQGFARGKRRVLVIKAEGVEMPCTRLVRQVAGDAGGAGDPGGGARPSGPRRASELPRPDAVRPAGLRGGDGAARRGDRRDGGLELAAPREARRPPTRSVKRFPLERVLRETAALEDGSSPVMARRLDLLREVEGVLPLVAPEPEGRTTWHGARWRRCTGSTMR